MDTLDIIILGILQGLTEFLPVSSSGHLILAPQIFGFQDQGLAMDAILHLATVLAIIIFFRKDLFKLLQGLIHPKENPVQKRLAWSIIWATFPAGVVGLAFGDWISENLRSPQFVAYNLIFWSIVFWWADRHAKQSDLSDDQIDSLSMRQVISIGFAQAIALLPGTSRSGITITAGIFCHLSRTDAARFSFLLGTPIILAAGLLKFIEFLETPASENLFSNYQLFVGFLSAFLVGYWAINILLKIVAKVGLVPFVIYRIVLAFIILIYFV